MLSNQVCDMSAFIWIGLGSLASWFIFRRLNSVENYEYQLIDPLHPKYPHIDHSVIMPTGATGNLNYGTVKPAGYNWLGVPYYYAEAPGGRKTRVYLNHTSVDDDNFSRHQ
jgi:hypothetical protein